MCEIRVVEEVYEIGTELKFHALPDREVFLHAQVDICVSRPDDRTLSRAIPKGECWRCREERWIVPLNSGTAYCLRVMYGTIAVRASTRRTGARIITSVQG